MHATVVAVCDVYVYEVCNNILTILLCVWLVWYFLNLLVNIMRFVTVCDYNCQGSSRFSTFFIGTQTHSTCFYKVFIILFWWLTVRFAQQDELIYRTSFEYPSIHTFGLFLFQVVPRSDLAVKYFVRWLIYCFFLLFTIFT